MDMTKIRLMLIVAAFAVLTGLSGVAWYRSTHAGHAVTSQTDPSIHIGGPFSLIDQDHKPVTEQVLSGKWTAVFFGYTLCPDVCPLTLQNLAHTKSLLGDKAKDLQIVFITVDPERDTPANLKAYLNSGGFPPGVIGLTGTPDQVKTAEKAYRATAERVKDGDTYAFSHTSVIFLMDPKGQFNAPLTGDMSPQQNASLIKQAMAAPY